MANQTLVTRLWVHPPGNSLIQKDNFHSPCTYQWYHTHPFNGPLSGTTQVSRYQKGKTDLDFTEARDSEWQWHQLGHMQLCTSLQTDNHTSTPPLSFLQTGRPSCHPTNSVRALKAYYNNMYISFITVGKNCSNNVSEQPQIQWKVMTYLQALKKHWHDNFLEYNNLSAIIRSH